MSETWWIDEAYRDQLTRVAPLSVAAWMRISQPSERAEEAREPSRLLSWNSQSAVYRLECDGPLLVKWSRPTRKRHRTFIRASRERREALASLWSIAHDVGSISPWGVGEIRSFGHLRGSVLVRPFRGDLQDLCRCNDLEFILPSFVRTLRAWHDRGFRHGDCHLRNFLTDSTLTEFIALGCPAFSQKRPGVRQDRERSKDLAQLARSTENLVEGKDKFFWLSDYVDASPGMDAKALMCNVVQSYKRRVQKRLRTKMKSRPTLPKPLELDVSRKLRIRTI